jgi:hypothetical protein
VARSLSLVTLTIPVAFLSLIGCGNGGGPSGPVVEFDPCQPLALVLDPAVTAAHQAGVTAGLALWNGPAGTHLTLADPELLADTPASPDAGAAAPLLPLHFQPAGAPFHGLYDPSGKIFINDDLTDHPEAVTVAHEVGHSFGLVHISPDVRPSVMNPGNLVIEPTAADIDTLQMRWGHCQ